MSKEDVKKYLFFFRQFAKNEIFDYTTDAPPPLLKYSVRKTYGFAAADIKKQWLFFLEKFPAKLKENIQLYVHAPFCLQRCSYCHNPSDKFKNKQDLDFYINNINQEILYFYKIFKNIRFSKLSIGGGTPNILNENQLGKLLSSVFKYFKFQEGIEKEIEFNPLFTTYKKLKLLKNFGINRISFGVQSLNKDALIGANRSYSNYGLIKKSIFLAKKAGFWNISVDLIMGFREESYEEFEENLLKICSLHPYRIEIYFLKPPNQNYLDVFFGGDKEAFYKRMEKLKRQFFKGDIQKKIKKFNYMLIPAPAKEVGCVGLIKVDPSYYWFRDFRSKFLSSCFGMGKYAESSIFGRFFYSQKDHFDSRKAIFDISAVN